MKKMNKEDVKLNNSMRDVVGRYDFYPNRAGFIQCPFHKGDRTASMRIYKDSYYCFGCGATGDIFTFVQNMDNVTFKEAFQILGGTYEKPTFSSRLAVYKAQKAKEMRQKDEEKKQKEIDLNIVLIDAYRSILSKVEPLTDTWCDAYNYLQKQLYKHGEIHGIPY